MSSIKQLWVLQRSCSSFSWPQMYALGSAPVQKDLKLQAHLKAKLEAVSLIAGAWGCSMQSHVHLAVALPKKIQ